MDDINLTGNTPPTESQTVSIGKSKPPAKKESSTVLNLILIVIGLIFIGKGLLDLVVGFKLLKLPDWLVMLHTTLSSKEAGAALSFFGSDGINSTILGIWSLIAGIILFREGKSGWGIAIVVLSIIAGSGISSIAKWISAPSGFDFLYWPNWVMILTTAASVLGFLFLLLTKKHYN
jgi:hypothetical protein